MARMTLVALMLWPTLALAEVSRRPSTAAGEIIGPAPMQLTCWQEGRQIIHEEALLGVNLGGVANNPVLSFRRMPDQGARVMVVTLDQAVCLVKPQFLGK
jgi:hypothetical protein